MFTAPPMVTLPDVEVRAPPDIVRLAADNVKAPFARTPPLRVRAFVTTMLFARLTVPPLTPRAGNVLWVDRVVIVPDALNVYVLVVPAFHVEPVPEVVQEPATVHVPVVTVSVPEVPPVMVRDDTPTVEAFAVRMPELPMDNAPPVRPRFAVASVVVFAPLPWTVRVPLQFSPFVPMVNVVVLAPELKLTLTNSTMAVPAKVIAWDAVELNVIGAAKDHETDVEAFDHAAETVHVPAPPEVM